MIHKILSGISVVAGFIAFAGIAGCIDLDVVTAEAMISAAVLVGVSILTGYLAYRESGMRRKKNSPR